MTDSSAATPPGRVLFVMTKRFNSCLGSATADNWVRFHGDWQSAKKSVRHDEQTSSGRGALEPPILKAGETFSYVRKNGKGMAKTQPLGATRSGFLRTRVGEGGLCCGHVSAPTRGWGRPLPRPIILRGNLFVMTNSSGGTECVARWRPPTVRHDERLFVRTKN